MFFKKLPRGEKKLPICKKLNISINLVVEITPNVGELRNGSDPVSGVPELSPKVSQACSPESRRSDMLQRIKIIMN